MDWALDNGLNPRSSRMVVFAGLLGAAAGFAMLCPLLLNWSGDMTDMSIICLLINTGLGFLVGAGLALFNWKYAARVHPKLAGGLD